jgi:hypothetical protein
MMLLPKSSLRYYKTFNKELLRWDRVTLPTGTILKKNKNVSHQKIHKKKFATYFKIQMKYVIMFK